MDFREITHSKIQEVRVALLEHQDFKCALCGVPLTAENACCDHQHALKSEELGVHGAGLIRGALCSNCNAMEGKVWNNLQRYGIAKSSDCTGPVDPRIQWLRNLISYYESNYQDVERILHPTERRPEKLGKAEYNRLIKFWKALPDSKKKDGTFKPQPKYTGRWSQTLKRLKFLMTSAVVDEEHKERKGSEEPAK